MMRLIARALLATAAIVSIGWAAEAATCSGWRVTCLKRGGGSSCDEKFQTCMSTGTGTEGAKWGGATHSGVTKK